MSEERLSDRINNLEKDMDEIRGTLDKSKKRKFNMWTKGLIGRRKLKMGYVIVVVINENGSVSFAKEPIVDSTIKLGDTFHVVTKDNLLVYKNRPLVIINKDKLHTFNAEDKKINETLGQKYILARMQNEAIMPKGKLGAMGGWIIFLLVLGGIAYYFFGRGGA